MKIKKLLFISILIIGILLLIFPQNCFAASVSGSQAGSYNSMEDPITNPDEYKPSYNYGSQNEKIKVIGKTVISAIQAIGTLICVVTLMVLGIRYMAGSVSEKATYKKTMIPYLIGAIMTFALPTILQVLYDMVMNIV